jgi:archaeal type IV pilus assembly protein PilA
MGKMKANRKFIEADERAVSAVIGVILMVAITVAIAATVYVYVSGMIGGTKNQTPNVAATTSSTEDKITIATADANIRWRDIVITTDTGFAWNVTTPSGTILAGDATTLLGLADNVYVTAGDYIALNYLTTSGNCRVTLKYTPTNSLLGTWTVNV